MRICLVCEGVASTEVAVCASCGARLLLTSEIHFPVRRGDEDAAHPLLGTLIDGKYRVAGVLGRGGMGTVFRATHEVSLMPLALKLLHPRFAGRPEYRRQFLAEARKAGRVVHEHTARILDVGETQDGSIYIAQELVPGTTLHEWQQAGEPLAPEVLVEILAQVCSALVAAHAVGLVHRDLTPRNIMVEVRQGRPYAKVLDFGLARGGPDRGGGGDDSLAAFASPPYAAPEHLSGQEVDARADLYGLGVIAYEALCGRVPTPGTTAREFAAATLAGELLPFAPRGWVPKELARLVQRLLARDPAARPPSAADVLAELRAIGAPRSGRLRIGALLALAAATVTLAVAFRAPPPAPFLRLAPQQELALLESMPRSADVQPLRSSELSALRFEFGGLDPRRLTVEVWHNGEAVARQSIQPEVGDHQFVLDRTQVAYASLLDAVRVFSQQGPVYLKFVVPGSPPLAYAAIRIDDEPPVLKVSLQNPGPGGAINGTTSVRIEMIEREPRRLALLAERDGVVLSIPLAVEARTLSPQDLVAAFPPPLPATDVMLRVAATDSARNAAESAPLRVPTLDLGLPSITRVVSARTQSRTLVSGSSGVRLHVDLVGQEPGLAVLFGPVGQEPAPCIEVVEAGSGLDATWLSPARAAQDGRYVLVLGDRAGNRATFTDDFTFATRQLDSVISVASDGVAESTGQGRCAVAASGILWNGLPVQLGLQCNPIYRPVSAEVARAAGEETLPPMARLVDVRDGAAQIALDEIDDGRYVLSIRARAALDGDVQTATYPLLVRREPPLLRLPAVGGHRFLPQLAEAGVLDWRGGTFGEGRAFHLVPADVRWLRGSVWFGRGRATPHALPERLMDSDPLLPRLQPWPGENVLGVCLYDALDRPVRVLHGDTPAPVLAGAKGDRGLPVAELLRFHWHDKGPRPRSSEVRVEHGQPAKFVLDAPLPYEPADALELLIETVPCSPRAFAPGRDGGVSVEFDLPFEKLRMVAGLDELSVEQFAENRVSEPFTLSLVAPDGRFVFDVRARTSRTTLEPIRLGDAAGPALPAAMRSVLMVPVLGPGLARSWRDPVGLDVEDRATFRPGPLADVRNVGDFYLQQHETTRGQYEQVVAAIQAAPTAMLPWREIVHRGDPLGAARLQAANMVPRALHGDDEAWRAAVRADPARPVAGIDYFQAHAFASASGWLLARDPALFRLPAGVELEIAAFGSSHVPGESGTPLQGASRNGGVRTAPARAAARARLAGTVWPLSAAELSAAGDRILTELGAEMTGLDFGVREWVVDLAAMAGDPARYPAASIDHVRHLEAAAELAREPARSDVQRALLRCGVVRGLAIDELASVHRDALGGERCPPRIPGVVRVLQLARDGSGVLEGETDPHLPAIGMRLCGGRTFLRWVRSR